MAQFDMQVENENYQIFGLPAGCTTMPPKCCMWKAMLRAPLVTMYCRPALGCAHPYVASRPPRYSGRCGLCAQVEKIGANVIWGDDFIEVSREAKRAVRPFDLNANHIPDAAMTLAVVALAARPALCAISALGA